MCLCWMRMRCRMGLTQNWAWRSNLRSLLSHLLKEVLLCLSSQAGLECRTWANIQAHLNKFHPLLSSRNNSRATSLLSTRRLSSWLIKFMDTQCLHFRKASTGACIKTTWSIHPQGLLSIQARVMWRTHKVLGSRLSQHPASIRCLHCNSLRRMTWWNEPLPLRSH